MLSLRSQRIQFCLYSSRAQERWDVGGGQIEDSVLKLRPPPPPLSPGWRNFVFVRGSIRQNSSNFVRMADIARNCRPRCGDFSSWKPFPLAEPWPIPFSFLNRNTIARNAPRPSNRRQIARTNRFCHPHSLIFLKTTIPIIQKSRSLVIIFIPLLFFVFLLASIQDNGLLLQKSRCLFYRTRNVRLLLFHTTLLLTRYFIGLNVCAQSVWWTRPLKIRSPFASFRPCLRPFVSVTKKKMEKKRGGEKGSSRRLQSGK